MAFMVAGLTAGSVVANSLGTDLLVSTGGFHEFFAGWYASPPPGLAWIGVIGLAVSVGVVFDSGIRLGAAIVVVMCLSYLITWLVSPLTGAAVATGVGAGVVFFIAKCVERLSPSLPAAVTFFPAFLLFVPGTLALVSFMTHDTQTISTALIAFASLCIGIHVSAFIDLWLDKTFWNNYRKRMKI